MSRFELDARRMLCPLPVIRTQDKVEQLQAGDILEVLCTDPGVVQDIPAWCRVRGHEILDIAEQSGEITVTLRVGEEA